MHFVDPYKNFKSNDALKRICTDHDFSELREVGVRRELILPKSEKIKKVINSRLVVTYDKNFPINVLYKKKNEKI